MELRLCGAVGPVARRGGPRRAFTLVEVLLVLAIVVIICRDWRDLPYSGRWPASGCARLPTRCAASGARPGSMP